MPTPTCWTPRPGPRAGPRCSSPTLSPSSTGRATTPSPPRRTVRWCSSTTPAPIPGSRATRSTTRTATPVPRCSPSTPTAPRSGAPRCPPPAPRRPRPGSWTPPETSHEPPRPPSSPRSLLGAGRIGGRQHYVGPARPIGPAGPVGRQPPEEAGVLELRRPVLLLLRDLAARLHLPQPLARGRGGHVARQHRAAQLGDGADGLRSEEHTSELQSRGHLVCRLLLEKKNE